jgi:hypothetical protein
MADGLGRKEPPIHEGDGHDAYENTYCRYDDVKPRRRQRLLRGLGGGNVSQDGRHGSWGRRGSRRISMVIEITAIPSMVIEITAIPSMVIEITAIPAARVVIDVDLSRDESSTPA